MRTAKFLSLFFLTLSLSGTAFSKEEKAAVPEDYSGKQSEEWNKVLSELQALKGKVDAQENVVKGLMVDKNHLQGEALVEKIKQVKVEHKKWQDMIAQFNKLNLDYETRFPEKGVHLGRKYKRMDVQSLESLDREVSFDTQVDRLQGKIFSQYPESGKKLSDQRDKNKKEEEKKRKEKILIQKKTQPTEAESAASSGDITQSKIIRK